MKTIGLLRCSSFEGLSGFIMKVLVLLMACCLAAAFADVGMPKFLVTRIGVDILHSFASLSYLKYKNLWWAKLVRITRVSKPTACVKMFIVIYFLLCLCKLLQFPSFEDTLSGDCMKEFLMCVHKLKYFIKSPWQLKVSQAFHQVSHFICCFLWSPWCISIKIED